ncbi:MAG: T9SS type A sorting domain-containing protein [Bacteroidia bacterium]
MKKAIFFYILFSLINIASQAQITYTWNGSSSSDWNTSSNWAPSGVPTTIDNVIIVTGANPCNLTATTTVNNLTMNNGTLNVGSFTLNINGNAVFNLGTVNGTGIINCSGTNAYFGTTGSGPTINPQVIANTLSIRAQRTTFNNDVNFTKIVGSSVIDGWRGGNTFNGNFTLLNASDDINGNNGDIYLGSNNGDPTDIFNGRAIFTITGTARIRVPQSGSAVFNGVVEFNANGSVNSHDRIQPARFGSASCIFNDTVYATINSASTDIQFAFDAGTNCTFNGPLVCNRISGPAAAAFDIGRDGTVTFNHNVIVNNNSTGSIAITNGTGTSTLANGRTISVGAFGFNSGAFSIQNFTQLGSTNQTLLFSSTASLFIGAAGSPCIFNANSVNFNSGRLTIQQSTFNGITHTFSKTGATADDCGGNFFNGAVSINNSGIGEFRFSSVISADIFNSTVEITNANTSIVSISRTHNTLYPENITINNTSAAAGGGIFFGANGGSSTLAATKTISVGAGGYANGYLYLYRFNQIGSTPQNINLSGANTILRMGNQANITSGCNFGGNVIASARAIELTGNTFSGTTQFNQSGNGGNRLWGGNIFTGAHIINISGAANIQCSQLFAAETYLSTVEANLSNTGGLDLARSFNTNFPENITLTSTSTGSVSFGFNGGTSTLANGRTISIGGLGYTGNFLRLYSFNQIGTTPQILNLSGSASQIELGSPTNIAYGCNFGGNLTVTAVNFVITSSVFNGNCIFTKTGSGANNDLNGNNIFNGSLNFTNNCSVANVYVRMSNIFGSDTYNGITTLSTSCSGGGFIMARVFNGDFNENIICNSTNNGIIYFGVGNSNLGIATLAANKTISLGTFTDNGILGFRRFNQIGNTTQTLTTSGTASIEFGATIASGVTNSFSNWDGNVVVTTAGYTSINNSNFQRNFTSIARNYLNVVNSNFNITTGNTSLFRNGGTTNDDLGGNNVYNGNFTFSNSGSGRYRSGVTAYGGDTYNSNVNIINSGTGTISLAYNNGSNPIAGNLDLSSSNTGTIFFGEAATSNATTLSGFINVSSGNYINGNINLRFLTQNSGTNNITGTASALALTFNNCIINGALNITHSGSTTLTNSTFNDILNTTNSGTTTVTTSTFNGDVTMLNTNTTSLRSSTYNSTNNITSTSFILGGTLAQGNTFNGASTFNKTGTSNDDTNGGNVFNAQSTFNTNNATGRWRLAVNSSDNFNANAFFNQNAAGLLQPAYDFNCNFAGNITVSSPTGTAITFGANTGRATLVGTNVQSINLAGNGNFPIFRRLTSNKTSNHTILNTSIEISTELNLTSGNIHSSASNLLIMLNASTIAAVSDASFVNGPVRKIGNQAFTFPIGKEGNYYNMHYYNAYRPISISALSNTTHHFTAEYFMEDPHPSYNHGSLGAGLANISNCEYWILDRTNGTSNVNVTLSYKDFAPAVNCSGVNNQTDLRVARWNGTQWVSHGNGGTTGTITNGTVVTSAPVTTFSPFTLASSNAANNPLPIELVNFTAEPKEKKVILYWTTASEINNDYFDVQKSIDGVNFETFATVKGAGNSSQLLNYSQTDYNPYEGTSYYRLKQVDFDGTVSYSKIVAVNFRQNNLNISIFPNPSNGYISISNLDDNIIYTLQIFDVSGKLIDYKIIDKNSASSINISHLSSGFYTLQIHSDNQPIFVNKLIKE